METSERRVKVNGQEIEYKDIIYHTTITTFDFWDRIKILFGKKLTINSNIYVSNATFVITSEAKPHIPDLIKSRVKYGTKGGYCSFDDSIFKTPK